MSKPKYLKKSSFCILLFISIHCQTNAQIISDGLYSAKFSPFLGVSQWSSTAMDIGISSEFYKGQSVWQPVPSKYVHLFAHSLGVELLLQKKVQIIPKYSFWFHSSKLSVFSIGSSILYARENGVFIRPELGIIFPEKMGGLFGMRYLRLKLAYGYNFSFSSNPLPYGQNTVSLALYFGNNIGSYRAIK